MKIAIIVTLAFLSAFVSLWRVANTAKKLSGEVPEYAEIMSSIMLHAVFLGLAFAITMTILSRVPKQ
jgi:uncharacterized protein involved in cysteine biosynthesis